MAYPASANRQNAVLKPGAKSLWAYSTPNICGIVTALEDKAYDCVQEPPSNEQLMLQYRDGNTQAFTELYHRNKSSLYRYFLRQTQRNSIAEELSQDVWANIVRSRQRYQQTAKFTTFLYQIAHNRLVDYFRQSANRPGEHPAEQDCDQQAKTSDHPDKQAESLQASQRLLELLQELPEEQREAFILKEEAGLSVNEIAAVTNVNTETAKSRLRYAVAKLKQGLRGFL